MKSKQFNRNLYIIAPTLVIFAVGYYFYMEVYTKGKEANIISTKSRILEQMSHNLQVKVKSIGDNAVEYVNYLVALDKKDSKQDSLEGNLIKQNYIKYFNNSLEYVSFPKPEKNDTIKKDSLSVNSTAEIENLMYLIVLGNKAEKNKNKKIQFKISYDLLITGLIQQNVFDEYILIVDRNIVYSSLLNKPNLAIIEQEIRQTKGEESGSEKETSPRYIDLVNNLKTSKAAISGVTTYDINISNQPYKLFVCQVEAKSKTWHLCGLVKTGLLNQSKKEMAPWIGIVIFMLLSFIILGLPFIKLKVISTTEQLTSGTLLNAAISLFIGTSFIMLFIFFGSNFYWKKNQNETRLKDLADEINKSLNTEIETAYTQLENYDNTILANTKQVKDLPLSGNILKFNLGARYEYPTFYPYFDKVFWMDSTGAQKGGLTPFATKDNPSNYKSRAYFKNAGEWILPGKETERFRIESIVSRTSGDVKVALSKKSVKNMVTVMTSRFYSIIQPIIPQDYRFCIIDKNGKVWFHSDKLRNLQENFITECRNDESLLAAIFANTTAMLDVSYYDEPYQIYIKPLSPMPLYLVTMYDQHTEYAYQVQGMVITLLLFIAFVIFIIVEIIVLNVLKPFGRKSGWKNMIMDFVGAKEDQGRIYMVLGVLFVLITILYFVLTNPVNILNPLLFALVMVSFLLPYLKYALKGFSLKSTGRNIFAIINILFIIQIYFSSKNLLSSNDLINMKIFVSAIIVLLVACYFVLKSNFKLKYKSCNITTYVIFLLGLLLVFSVAPSIKFFEASVNHEIIRGIKHDQLMLARQRESRNRQLREYYKLMEQKKDILDPSVMDIYQKRMERGIYSNFVGSAFYVQNNPNWEKGENDYKKCSPSDKDSIIQRSENIINLFRPVYDSLSIETKYLHSDSLLNGKQRWSICDTTLFFDYFSTSEIDNKTAEKSQSFVSGKEMNQEPIKCRIKTHFHRPDIFNPRSTFTPVNPSSFFQKHDIPFILLLLTVFYGIYLLIVFGTRRILGISIIEMYNNYNFEKFVHERLTSEHSLMVISSPFINLEKHLKETLKNNFKLSVQDFAKLENIVVNKKHAGEKDVLIIMNFASDYYSVASLKLQLDIISEKIRQKEKMVIIGINAPYLIQEYLEKKIMGTVDLKDKDKADAIAESCEQLLLSFNYMLSNVNVLHSPQKYDQDIPQISCYSKPECGQVRSNNVGDFGENLKCSICKELTASDYLKKYVVEMMKYYDELVDMDVPRQIIKDRIIAKIMELSQLYYDSILASCTPMERFVLSDMAQDMIVNSKNKKVVTLLINRGLFVIDGCAIRFMNESFRKHVVLRFTDEEKARLKEKLGDTGTSWQGFKLILVLVMIGLITFLFIANRSILDNLNKLFLVIGGGTVLITNLTGLLTRKETGNAK